MIKVLIVDDSVFVRRTLKALLEQEAGIEVVGMAADGASALEMARALDPDVITLDVEMPRMDGLEALKAIMAEVPCPVIMISSLANEGAETTFKALDLGALDYIAKPSSGSIDLAVMQKELGGRVRALAKRKALMRLMHKNRMAQAARALAQKTPATAQPFSRALGSAPAGGATRAASAPLASQSAVRSASALQAEGGGLATPARFGRPPFDAVCIGVSTGGPPAVQKVLSALPANFPVPILIAQHMPMSFTGPFAARLDSQSNITVLEAFETQRLKPGTAYVCRGGKHLRLEMRGGVLHGVVNDEPKTALYKPSANELMESAAATLGKRVLCVMLTGMGNDGLEGTKVLKARGGYAIAQSEGTCVVYGMPKAIVDAKLADEIVDIDQMASAILAHFVG